MDYCEKNTSIKLPKISVIIPIYNAKRYINRCINSICIQDYPNIEVIIIDDGSKDGSSEICDKYADSDNRIKIIHQTNLGVSIARNNGINNCSGDYLVFVDADDFLFPGAISHLYNNMTQTNSELVCGSYVMEKTRKRKKIISYQDKVYKDNDYDDNFIDILRKISNAPWGKLFDTEIIRKNHINFPEKIPYAEDTTFLIRYCKCISSLSVCGEILYNYNYIDYNSAVNKFYPDLYQYFDLVLKEKDKFFIERGKYNIYASKRIDDEEYYYEWCLKHYILHTKGENLKSLIAKATSVLLSSNASNKYQKYILDQDWDTIIKKWKKEHWKEIFTFNLKRFMKI